MALPSEPTPTAWSLPFTEQDWEQTPPAVQAYVHTLHEEMRHLRHEMTQLQERIEHVEARLQQNATTSSPPPSSDSPYKKPRRHSGSTRSRKGGGKPGHPGHRQVLWAPTTVEELMPETCVWQWRVGEAPPLLYAPGDRGATHRDGGASLGVVSGAVYGLWPLV
jgi:hypothetical protein